MPYLKKLKANRRKVLPGFPWTGKFTTKEEIENYFSDEDKIQCLLCGKWYKKLERHLQIIHGISQDEYRNEFGLPWKRGLVCKKLSNLHSKIMTKRIKDGFDPTPNDDAREKAKTATRRKDQPFLTHLKSEQLKKINTTTKSYAHKDFKIVLTRMLKKQKTLCEVCKDNDMPGSTSVYKHVKSNPEFKQQLLKTYYALPYSVQAKANILSPKFNHDAKRLQKKGFSLREIGSELGVSATTVRLHLKKG